MSSNLSKKSQRNFENHLKDRPSTSKEMISNSISKRTDRTSENLVNFPRQKSSSQEKELLSEQRGFSGKLMRQNIQIKALKSLIKNKYGSIPSNFLSV